MRAKRRRGRSASSRKKRWPASGRREPMRPFQYVRASDVDAAARAVAANPQAKFLALI